MRFLYVIKKIFVVLVRGIRWKFCGLGFLILGGVLVFIFCYFKLGVLFFGVWLLFIDLCFRIYFRDVS